MKDCFYSKQEPHEFSNKMLREIFGMKHERATMDGVLLVFYCYHSSYNRDSMYIFEIAEPYGLPSSRLSPILHRLQQSGFVEEIVRPRHPKSWRLTQEGQMRIEWWVSNLKCNIIEYFNR